MHRRLLSLWVTWALLLPLCWANQEDFEEEIYDYSTQTPDYDYNATFDYEMFSNTTGHEEDYSLYVILGGKKNVEEKDLENKALAIGSPCPALLLGLAAHQLHRLL